MGRSYILLLAALMMGLANPGYAQHQNATGIFVFGDSLVDAGNNKYLASLSQANFTHNGVDFQGGKITGRFCNGRTVVDVVADMLGLPFSKPYLDPQTKGEELLNGVNYASGGAGILDQTGLYFLQRLPLGKQVKYFNNTRSQLVELLGEEGTVAFLRKSMFAFVIGANDYLNNYVAPVTVTPTVYTPKQFQDLVISTFKKLLTTTYNLGARKFIISGAGPIGCIPYQLTLRARSDGTCAPKPNQLIQNFNKGVQDMVKDLNANLPNVQMVYANSYDAVYEAIRNPQAYGFKVANQACCGAGGPFKGLISCMPQASVCSDRSASFFWDPYHPSDAANVYIAGKMLDGNLSDIYPMNVRQLFEL